MVQTSWMAKMRINMIFQIYTLFLATLMISAFAADEKPKFQPMVGNGTHPEKSHGAGSQ